MPKISSSCKLRKIYSQKYYILTEKKAGHEEYHIQPLTWEGNGIIILDNKDFHCDEKQFKNITSVIKLQIVLGFLWVWFYDRKNNMNYNILLTLGEER